MAEYFTDETDPSIGRLYINYPMMESFRYCDTFKDDQYLSTTIPIGALHNFKRFASERKLSGISITTYQKDEFYGFDTNEYPAIKKIYRINMQLCCPIKPIKFFQKLKKLLQNSMIWFRGSRLNLY